MKQTELQALLDRQINKGNVYNVVVGIQSKAGILFLKKDRWRHLLDCVREPGVPAGIFRRKAVCPDVLRQNDAALERHLFPDAVRVWHDANQAAPRFLAVSTYTGVYWTLRVNRIIRLLLPREGALSGWNDEPDHCTTQGVPAYDTDCQCPAIVTCIELFSPVILADAGLFHEIGQVACSLSAPPPALLCFVE